MDFARGESTEDRPRGTCSKRRNADQMLICYTSCGGRPVERKGSLLGGLLSLLSLLLLLLGLVRSLLLLEVLGQKLLVSHVGFLGSLPLGNLALLVVSLAADSLVSDQALDARSFVESLVSLLDLAADDVLGAVILLTEGEGLLDLANSLRSESARLLVIGEAGDLAGTLLQDFEGEDAKVGTGDAASDGLALALTSSLGAVALNSFNNLLVLCDKNVAIWCVIN